MLIYEEVILKMYQMLIVLMLIYEEVILKMYRML